MSLIVTFSPQEKEIIELCQGLLRKHKAAAAGHIEQRLGEIGQLAHIANTAQSLHGDGRTWHSLAEKLKHQGIVEVVNQPFKAVAGRAFLVGKFHLFGYLGKLANHEPYLQALHEPIENCYQAILFLLLAEDLYTGAIADSKGHEEWLDAAVMELIKMWETRTDYAKPEFASDLRQLWKIRQTIAPAFGTLLGTMEMMKHMLGLSGAWHLFVETIEQNSGMSFALEEYLFSLSHEQITALRQRMLENGVAAIGRQEVTQWLGDEDVFHENGLSSAALALYRSFLRRQAAAHVRRNARLPGPRRTLEEYFTIFLLRHSVSDND